MQKWNYMRFDVGWIAPVDEQHFWYSGIKGDQNDVEETDADVPEALSIILWKVNKLVLIIKK